MALLTILSAVVVVTAVATMFSPTGLAISSSLLLQLCVHYFILRPYHSNPTATAALQGHSLYGATIGFAGLIGLFLATFLAIAVPILLLVLNLAVEWLRDNIGDEDAMTMLGEHLRNFFNQTQTKPVDLFLSAFVALPWAIANAVIAWMFTWGYAGMLVQGVGGGHVVVAVRVQDIVVYSLAGAMGMLMGRTVLLAWTGTAPISPLLPSSAHLIITFARHLASACMEIVMVISCQTYVALAVARRDALGMSSGVLWSVTTTAVVRLTFQLTERVAAYAKQESLSGILGTTAIYAVIGVGALAAFAQYCRLGYSKVMSVENAMAQARSEREEKSTDAIPHDATGNSASAPTKTEGAVSDVENETLLSNESES